ncbi:hypothetical protein GA0116948_105239 [Chitinophaga costaii]|uniref:Uncharacterized protein n=1 Tax=Chitinophaga costaii TaxID=1335309 RepID=A0A1C4DEX3_9BACT|nr:hypothetical protein [Chitinophaga costaii]PUZ24598.1 hypothetical protein DCM91_11940 [Chitinophaga costaii]SCC29891.1 hypothetical protein GA0116948_105239 [Chitinophaga costaii]
MKKVIYSALAVTAAIAGVAATKANTKTHRAVYLYRYIGTTPVTSASLVTNVNNWTLVSTPSSCIGSVQACGITTTIVSASNKPTEKIPAIATDATHFTANTGSFPSGAGDPGTNVIASHSKDL